MQVHAITGLCVGCLMAASALFGLREMQLFESTPGVDTAAAAHWPSGVAIPPPSGKPVLLLFIHPLCSCTAATLSELERILAQSGPVAELRIFFEPEEGVDAGLWRRAASLPNAATAVDTGGVLAARFGARTSGALKLYDGGGQLRFSGGITFARGHEGSNRGASALLAALRDPQSFHGMFPVFGCALFGERS